MIIKGVCRSNGGQLAAYLFREKNEAVSVLEIRGTVSTDLNYRGVRDSLQEFDAVGALAGGKKNLFHVVIRLMHELVKAGMTASRIAAIIVKGIDSEAQTEAAHTFITEAGYTCLSPALPLKPSYASALDYAKSPTEVTHPKARARAEACLQAAIDFITTTTKE